jgi:hypothetical protein
VLCRAALQVSASTSTVDGGTGALTLLYSYTFVSGSPSGALSYSLAFLDFGGNPVVAGVSGTVSGFVVGR